MKKLYRYFFRGKPSKIQLLRELAYLSNHKSLNKSKYFVVSLQNYDLFMLIDVSDEWGSHLIKFGYIEKPEEIFIKKLIRKGNTIIDIGAHWGGFSLIFGKLTGKEGKVFSFEASNRNFKFLNKNICINKLKEVINPYHYAVGDKEEEIHIAIAKTSSGHNSISRKNLPTLSYEKVRQITIDSFCEQNRILDVDFIKIDVEGYELEVLKGMEETIKKNKDLWMFIEFSPAFMEKEKAEELLFKLKTFFPTVYLAHKKKIFKSDWKEVKEISFKIGQRNLFLYR